MKATFLYLFCFNLICISVLADENSNQETFWPGFAVIGGEMPDAILVLL